MARRLHQVVVELFVTVRGSDSTHAYMRAWAQSLPASDGSAVFSIVAKFPCFCVTTR